MDSKVVWLHPKLPIKICRFPVRVDKLNQTACRKELERLIIDKSDGQSKTWGYFPEMNPDDREYPATLELIRAFEEQVIGCSPMLKGFELQLAFVRRATDEPRSNFGGFHVDASAGIGHQWPADISLDSHVLRLLFNLDRSPRILEYCPLTSDDLRNNGIDIARDHYEMLEFPKDVPIEKIKIPPIESDAVHGLMFISTKVPHAGKTTSAGHFLISYGAYITPLQAEAFAK